MPEPLAPAPFRNPVWHSLRGAHHGLGIHTPLAARYLPDVSPFAALAGPSPEAFAQLASLLSPGERIWLIEAAAPPANELLSLKLLPGLQMLLPTSASPAAPPPTDSPRHPAPAILPLAAPDLPDMLALIAIAFPGFFLPGTPRMGSWFGIRVAGELVAMAGERFLPPGWPEISGLCTHPAHRGHGFAAHLLNHLTRRHRTLGLRSWLEVGAANTHAIALYQQLGFRTFAEVTFQQVRRPGTTKP